MSFLDGYGYTPGPVEGVEVDPNAEPDNNPWRISFDYPGTERSAPGGIAGAWDALAAGATTAWQNTSEGLKYKQVMDGQLKLDEAFRKESQRIDQELAYKQVTYNDSWLFQGAQAGGSWVSTAVQDPATAALYAGAIGAGLAAPFTGGTSAVLAPTLLAGAATATGTYKVEGGNEYKTLSQAGVAPDVAKRLATIYGIQAAAVETAGTVLTGGMAGGAIKGLAKGVVMPTVAKLGLKPTAAGLQNITMRQGFASAAKAIATSAATEPLTEGAQEALSIRAEGQARQESPESTLPETTDAEDLDRVLGVMKDTAKGAIVLGGLGGSITLAIARSKTHQAVAARQFFTNLNNAGEGIRDATNPLGMVRGYLSQQFGGLPEGVESKVYIDGGAFRQAMTEANVTTEDLQTTLPDVAQKLDQAIKDGTDVAIPTEQYGVKIAGTPLGQRLFEHARLDPEALSYADAVRVNEALGQWQQDLAALGKDGDLSKVDPALDSPTYQEMRAQVQSEAIKRLQEAHLSKEDGSPLYTNAQLRAQAKYEAAVVSALAHRSGLTTEQALGLLPQINNVGEPSKTLNQPIDKYLMMAKSREFDQRLSDWANGKGEMSFDLGMPSWVLQLFGLSKGKSIEANRAQFVHILFPKKVQENVNGVMIDGNHGFTPDELRGLLVAIQQPLAVFSSGHNNSKAKSVVLLTELKRNVVRKGHKTTKDVIVPIRVTVRERGMWVDLNEIVSTYEKDQFKEDWFRPGRLLGVEKTKGLEGIKLLWRDSLANSRSMLQLHRSISSTADSSSPARGDSRPLPSAEDFALPQGTIIYENETSIGDLYQKNQGIRGGYNPESNVLTLTPNADLSTFAHEMGHWYLAHLLEFSKLENAAPTVKEDAATMLKHFGLKSVAEWDALGLEGQRKFHEEFAYDVEIYLATGKPPVKEVAGFFQRFGQWIRDVYRQWRGGVAAAKNAIYQQEFGTELPPLSPEVTGVLERMLMSEGMAVEAERTRGLQPLFREKPADMSDADWAELQRDRDTALQEATEKLDVARARDERWEIGARSKAMREIQKQGAEIRAKIREKVERQVNGRPEIKALDALKSGGKALGIENLKMSPEGLKACGLDVNTIARLRALGVVKEGGMDPDMTRQLLSPIARFKSVKKMVSALLTAGNKKDLIEQETTRRCLDQYSQFFDPEKMQKLVTESLASEARARALATELKYLSGDKTASARIYRAAAREAAQQMLDAMPYTQATAKRFITAAASFSRKAYDALARGDRPAAAQMKRLQMVQHEAALLALELEKQKRKFAELRKIVLRGGDKKLAPRLDTSILAMLRELLYVTGFGPSNGEKITAAVERVKAYDPEKYAQFQEIVLRHAARAIAPAERTVAQFRELCEDAQGLYRLARDAKSLLLEGRREDVDAAVHSLVTQLTSRGLKEYHPGQKEAVTNKERYLDKLLTAKAFLTRVESWCAAMDAGNDRQPFQTYIFRPIANAAARYRVKNMALQEKLIQLIKPRREKWEQVHDIEFTDGNGHVIYTFRRKAELIGALLHCGNASNKRKLLLGGRGREQAPWGRMRELANGEQVLDSSLWDAFVAKACREGIITAEDMQFVQSVWDLLEDTKPLVQKAYQEYYGLYFEEVPAQSFSLPLGPHGEEMVLRGGYVPAVTDPDLVPERNNQEASDLMKQADFTQMFPVTRPGFTQSRQERYTEPLKLDVGLVGLHIQKAMKFAFLAPAALQVQKILAHSDFKSALNAIDPKAITDLLAPWLKRSVEQTVGVPTNAFGRWLNKFRGLAGMNLMAGNIVNVLQQVTGLSVAASKVPAADLANAAKTFLSAPKKTVQQVMDASVFMKARLQDRAFEFQSELESIASARPPSKPQEIRDYLQRKAYILQTAVQEWIDVPVWSAGYNQAIRQGKSHEEAVADADSLVRTTQSSFDPESVSRVETGSPLWRALLVFYNYMTMQLNLLGERWAVARATKAYGRFAWDAVLIIAIPAIVSEIISQAFSGFDTGDDDDWDALDALQLMTSAVGKNIIAMIPLGGNVINVAGTKLAKSDVPIASTAAQYIFGRNPYNDRVVSLPVTSLLENAAGAPGSVYGWYSGEGTAKSAVRNTLDLMTLLTRVPFGALKRPVGYAAGVAAGEIQPQSAADVARGVISGKDVNAE